MTPKEIRSSHEAASMDAYVDVKNAYRVVNTSTSTNYGAILDSWTLKSIHNQQHLYDRTCWENLALGFAL